MPCLLVDLLEASGVMRCRGVISPTLTAIAKYGVVVWCAVMRCQDRLPELLELGVTTVVLSPLCAQMPGSGPGGRVPVNYFSPEASLAVDGTAEGAADELKQVQEDVITGWLAVTGSCAVCIARRSTFDCASDAL